MQSLRSPTVAMLAASPLPHLLRPSSSSSSSSETTISTTPTVIQQDDLKRIAAHRAVGLVESGMVLGLGTGSTAYHAIERLGELLRLGKLRDIVCIPTSKKTEAHALSLGIPLSDLNSHPYVDLSIDGADEVDPHLNLVKGRGGSLLREKMIESVSRRFVVIVDESKLVERLGGSGHAVPVEVVPFGWHLTLRKIMAVFDPWGGCEARLRVRKGPDAAEGVPCETDNLNYVVDLFFEDGITADLDAISDSLLRITGVVEHGMFLGLATSVIVASKDGVVVKTRE